MSGVSLEESVAYCQAMTRERAKNFYFGMRLTPEPKRSALYACYTFFVACDALADEGEAVDVPDRLAQIDAFEERMLAGLQRDSPAGDEPWWPAFLHACQTYPIETLWLQQMLEGQRDDTRHQGFTRFEELERYCHHVASTVGLICLAIWGYDGESSTRKLAMDRGVAFQLTNILRDLREDRERGRDYLPLEDFDRFQLDPEAWLTPPMQPAVLRMMRFQCERAQSYYEHSIGLEKALHPDGRANCKAMTSIYHGLLERISRQPARALKRRARLSLPRKLSIAVRAKLGA